MGGKNPLVVLDDADLNRAVAVALDGAFFGSGQRCTASSRLVVTAGIHDRFVALLGEKVRSLKVGHALDPNVQVGPVASDDPDRKSVVSGKSVSVRVDLGGRRIIKKKKEQTNKKKKY